MLDADTITDEAIRDLARNASSFDGDPKVIRRLCKRALGDGLTRTQMILLAMIERACPEDGSRYWMPRAKSEYLIVLPTGEIIEEYRPRGAQDGNAIKALWRKGLAVNRGVGDYSSDITEQGRQTLKNIRTSRARCAEIIHGWFINLRRK